ncbi:MAG: M23 family metallopeptidase [Acidobacteria bacterium]|nr:M23 family metallopeptidase [Acidobacteriota bacterium]
MKEIPLAESFAYPVGKQETLTAAKDDKDEWYQALKFGEQDHLGEDWNKNSGGNTDCGEPVYAAANGEITFAADAGAGWGNVLIITHQLPDGTEVQTLYGHLQEMLKTRDEVQKGEQIGKVGSANGRYLCHLHFEIRDRSSRDWNRPGGGYSTDRTGWLAPSEFIGQRRKRDR